LGERARGCHIVKTASTLRELPYQGEKRYEGA
jgi:hypothetical protein